VVFEAMVEGWVMATAVEGSPDNVQADAGTLPTVMGKVRRPDPLRIEVARTLKSFIIGGNLPFGTHLVETELAQSLGVSRLPVREALQLLAQDGWVDLRKGFGAFVHTPSAKEVDEVFSVRTVLEAEAARQAAVVIAEGRADEQEIVRLKDVFEEGVKEVEVGHKAAIGDKNSELHFAIVDLTGNSVLGSMVSLIEERVRWYFGAIALRRAPASWEEHAQVIDAILAGDSSRAHDLMAQHCERSRIGLLDMSMSGFAKDD
jgi:DNA-binding GntR family transcriptional regulator